MDEEEKAALVAALDVASPLHDTDWSYGEDPHEVAVDRYHPEIADEIMTALDALGWKLVRK